MRVLRQLFYRSDGPGRPFRSSRASRPQRTISHAAKGGAWTASDAKRLAAVLQAEEVCRQFLKSTVSYIACDAAALALIILPGGKVALLAGGLPYAAARFGLATAALALSSTTASSPITRLLQCALVGTGDSMVQLPATISQAARVAAFLASSCTGTVLAFPDLAHHSAVHSGELEEVPLTGRQRPAMPVVSEFERECRGSASEILEARLNRLGPGAEYLPTHHPESQRAQEELQRLRTAADALIVEQCGVGSAVAQKYQQHFAGHDIPVKVFWSKETDVAGTACPAGITVKGYRSAAALASVLAHELAHMICRHRNEEVQNMDDYPFNASCWSLGALMLRSLGKGGLITTCCGLAIKTAATHIWQLAPARPPVPITGGVQPLLQPGQLGFYAKKSLSKDICQELEAEQVAMLIMARAGMDPAYVAATMLPIYPQADTKELVAHLESYAKGQHGSLSVIQADERFSTGSAELAAAGWPNIAKLAMLYAEVLPQARAIYGERKPSPFSDL